MPELLRPMSDRLSPALSTPQLATQAIAAPTLSQAQRREATMEEQAVAEAACLRQPVPVAAEPDQGALLEQAAMWEQVAR